VGDKQANMPSAPPGYKYKDFVTFPSTVVRV